MKERANAGAQRPWHSPVRLAQRLLIYAVAAYLTLCVFLFFNQNSLEYPRGITGAALPKAQALREARQAGLVPWAKTTPGAAGPQGYVPVDFEQPFRRGTMVVFHGNGAWAKQRTAYVDALERRGFRVFLYEYPGYGGRPGTPHESTIVPDARALIRSLEAANYGPIYVWGESLGAGVAAAVCAEPTLPVHGLVLLTPWDTVANVGLYRYPYVPVRLLMTDRYDSVANLEHFRHPICVVQSTKDEIIPAALTNFLYAHLPEPKKLILQQGYRHEDWPSAPDLAWWDEAVDFVAGK